MNHFEQLTPQEKLVMLYKLQDIIKDVQKLSWKAAQIMKRFPLEQAQTTDYPTLLKIYLDLISEIKDIQAEIK